MSQYKRRRKKAAKKRFDFQALNNNQTEQNFMNTLSAELKSNPLQMQWNTLLNDHLITSIQKAADETIPKKEIQKLYRGMMMKSLRNYIKRKIN